MNAVSVRGLEFGYDRPLFSNFDLEVAPGEFLGVIGPNGAGKSTLLRLVAGLLRPGSGSIALMGRHLGRMSRREVARRVAVVPQESAFVFDYRVADVVMMGRIGKLGPLRWPKAQDWAYVRQCLKVVGMTELADRQISELSGGQQQRMFIARALAQEAELMLMDEPLTGLDLTSQEDAFLILDELKQRQVTVVVATHDLSQAADRFDRVMLLNRRILGLGTAAQVFTPERLMDAYGGHLRLIRTNEGLMVLGDTCCEGEDTA